MKLQHFILTRSHYTDPELARRRKVMTDTYHRPSIEAQTCQNFTQLLVEPANPQWEVVAPHIDEDTTHVLTTRVDDDDCLAVDHVERLQAEAQCRTVDETILFHFPIGYVTDGKLCVKRNYPNNQFISLLTPVTKPLTVFCEMHDRIHRRFLRLCIDREPAWLWVLHPDQITHGGKNRKFTLHEPFSDDIRELYGVW